MKNKHNLKCFSFLVVIVIIFTAVIKHYHGNISILEYSGTHRIGGGSVAVLIALLEKITEV